MLYILSGWVLGGPGHSRRRRGRPGRRGAKTVGLPARRGAAAPGGRPWRALDYHVKAFWRAARRRAGASRRGGARIRCLVLGGRPLSPKAVSVVRADAGGPFIELLARVRGPSTYASMAKPPLPPPPLLPPPPRRLVEQAAGTLSR